MRLHYHPFSTNARRAVVTAFEIRVPVEFVRVDLQKKEQRSPAFLQLNPAGRVPVLEDSDLVLSESHAIMIHLADRASQAALYPSDSNARAQVNRWMFWCAAHFQPATSVLNWERMVKPMIGLGGPDPKEEERGERLIAETAGLLDAHLSKHQWLVGAHLTLADISLATPLLSTQRAGLPVLEYRHLQRWYGQIQELESWGKAAALE